MSLSISLFAQLLLDLEDASGSTAPLNVFERSLTVTRFLRRSCLAHPLGQMSIQEPYDSLIFYSGKLAALRNNDKFHEEDIL